MSIRVMSWLWENSTASGTELLVLLAIADHASDDGSNAWPTTGLLARKCRISDRTVQRITISLASRGLLMIDPNAGRNGSNRYRIVMESTPDRLSGVTDRRPDMGVTTPPTPMSGEPSLNRPYPPTPGKPGELCSPDKPIHDRCRGCGTNRRARDTAARTWRPAWCGECDPDTRLVELDDARPARCPACHPSTTTRPKTA